MRLYEPPAKEFFRLPNSIFHVPLDATQFKLYAYLVCCSGSKGYCWPTHKKIIQDIVLSAPHPVGVSVRVKKNQQANIEYKSAEKVLIS